MVGYIFFFSKDNMHVLFKYELLCSINSYKHCPDGAKLMIVLFLIIFSWLVAVFKISEQLLWKRDTCGNGALLSVCSLVKFVRDLKHPTKKQQTHPPHSAALLPQTYHFKAMLGSRNISVIIWQGHSASELGKVRIESIHFN